MVLVNPVPAWNYSANRRNEVKMMEIIFLWGSMWCAGIAAGLSFGRFFYEGDTSPKNIFDLIVSVICLMAFLLRAI